MHLSVQFLGCTRPKQERVRLETEFRDAMLNYCPSVEKLCYWQKKHHFEYLQAKQRGYWAVHPLMTDKEISRSVPIVRIEE